MEREQGKDEFGKGIRWGIKRIHDEFVWRIRVRLHVLILSFDSNDLRGNELGFEKLMTSYLHLGSIGAGEKVDSLWEKLSDQEKGRFARWTSATVAEELRKKAGENNNREIQNSLNLTAWRILNLASQATKEFEGVLS